MGPNGEGHGPPVRREAATIGAEVVVPAIARLARIRWFELRDDNRLAYLGESRWTGGRRSGRR